MIKKLYRPAVMTLVVMLLGEHLAKPCQSVLLCEAVLPAESFRKS